MAWPGLPTAPATEENRTKASRSPVSSSSRLRRLDLGAEHGVEAVRGEAAEDAVVEDPGGVDDGVGPVLGEQRGQLVAVGDVAAGDDDALVGAGFAAGAAGQYDAVGALAEQPLRDVTAERAGATGDQDGAARLPRRRRRGGRREAAAVDRGGADGDLVVVAGECSGEAAEQAGVEVGREIGEAAPAARVLQRGDAAEPPDRGLRGRGERVGRADGDGAPGDAPQRGVGAEVVEGLDERGRGGEAGGLVEGEQRNDGRGEVRTQQVGELHTVRSGHRERGAERVGDLADPRVGCGRREDERSPVVAAGVVRGRHSTR